MLAASSPVPEIKAQLLKEEAVEAIAKAHVSDLDEAVRMLILAPPA